LPDLIQRWVKKAMKDVLERLNKLCSRVDVVEGAVSSLRADVRELQNRAPVADPGMSFLDEAMGAPSIALGPSDDLFTGLMRNMGPNNDVMVMRMKRLMMMPKNSQFREFYPSLFLLRTLGTFHDLPGTLEIYVLYRLGTCSYSSARLDSHLRN
ncbi:hypothetical protein HAX54_034315, partial [Datura stramonium]|nr:hypothetical protein [Datura stramonium]